jgi:hypothetical protein
MDEYERRAQAVTAALDARSIDALVSDLPAATLPAAAARTVPSRAEEFSPDRLLEPGEARASAFVASIFGGATRSGTWKAPRSVFVVSIFGGSNIDLRRAKLPPEGVKIRVISIFGGTSVVVPPDVSVHTAGFGLFGGFGGPHDRDGLPGAPLVSVSGIAIFGGAGVAVKK